MKKLATIIASVLAVSMLSNAVVNAHPVSSSHPVLLADSEGHGGGKGGRKDSEGHGGGKGSRQVVAARSELA